MTEINDDTLLQLIDRGADTVADMVVALVGPSARPGVRHYLSQRIYTVLRRSERIVVVGVKDHPSRKMQVQRYGRRRIE